MNRGAFIAGWIAWVRFEACDPPTGLGVGGNDAWRAGWTRAADRNEKGGIRPYAAEADNEASRWAVDRYADAIAQETVAIHALLDVCHAYKNGAAPYHKVPTAIRAVAASVVTRPRDTDQGTRVHLVRMCLAFTAIDRALLRDDYHDLDLATAAGVVTHQIRNAAEDLHAERAAQHSNQEKV